MLDADALQKINKKNLTNILRKLDRGGTLTAREQAILSGASGESGYCQNLDELAAELGVDRRTLANAKKRWTKDYGIRHLERADGRYHIAGWREFLDAHGVIGRGKGGDPDVDDERALKLRAAKFDLDRKEYELQKSKDLMLAVAEFEAALGIMVAAFNATLNALPGRAATKMLPRVRTAVLNALRAKLPKKVFAQVDEVLSGPSIIDFADVEEILSREVDIAKQTIVKCDYLENEVDEDLE